MPARAHLARRTALERRVRELSTAFIAARPGLTRSTDPARTAWVVVLTMEYLASRFVLEPPPFSREEFLDEVVLLFSGYAVPGG